MVNKNSEYCEHKGNATQRNNGDIKVIILLRFNN